MTIDHTFMSKKMQKLGEVLVIFSQFTKLPFVECDSETFDDQVHVFSKMEDVQEFVKSYGEQKILLGVVKFTQEQLKGFYITLHTIGVNALVLHEGDSQIRIPLDELEKKPKMDSIEKSKLPVLNPGLQLSAIYFIQELRRPAEHDMKKMQELEEEMMANMARSKFAMVVDVVDDPKAEPRKEKQFRMPYIKDKEGNIYQPIFSDFTEFRRHFKQDADKMKVVPLSVSQLPNYLVKDAKGFVLNPAGFALPMTKHQIDRIMQVFPKTQQQ